ncbi:MAG TPA: GNAT family N-acetyltransferase [Ktedonobacteraceae bacterium]|nr:GNAT family N-acetyltransferase [Ktedonobacteraceae bacterium]
MTLPFANSEQPLGTFWQMSLASSPAVEISPRVPANFKQVGAEETPALAQAMGNTETTEVLRRFSTGRRCYAAMVGNVLAAYGWVSLEEEEIGELHLHIRLARGEAYIWDCATIPAYRGQRLYPALLTYIARQLQSEGLSRIWIGADSDNYASQTGMALAGFQPIADIVDTCVLALRRLWLRGRPGVPEDLVADIRRMVYGDRAFAWQEAASHISQK